MPASQIVMEQQALQILQEAVITDALAVAKRRLLTLNGETTQEAADRLDSVLEEWALNYVLKALNSDPHYPQLMRHIYSAPYYRGDTSIPGNRGYGGDNPDTSYAIIPIDAEGHYRLSGTLPPEAVNTSFQLCADPTLSVQLAVLPANEMAVSASRQFSLDIAPSKPAGASNYLRAPLDSRYLLIRETRGDWSQPLGEYRVERVSGPARDRLSREQIIQRAARTLVHEVPVAFFWLAMVNGLPENQTVPAFVTSSVGGMSTARMSMARLRLAGDEAFVLRVDPSGAEYLGTVLMDYWQRSLDPAEQLTSLSQQQATANADGSITLVVSAKDPGVHNWLDTRGLESTKLMIRWQGLPEAPVVGEEMISGRLVKFSGLASVLPKEMVRVSDAQRQAQRETRKQHFYRQFQ